MTNQTTPSIIVFRAALFGAALALACQSQTPPAPSTEPVKPAATPPPVTTAAAPAPKLPEINLEAVPAEEDFEEEAEQAITSRNLEKQLEQLEKELAAE